MEFIHDEQIDAARLVIRAIERLRKREGRSAHILIQNFPKATAVQRAIFQSGAQMVSLEFVNTVIGILAQRIRDPTAIIEAGTECRSVVSQAAIRIKLNKDPPVVKQGPLATIDRNLFTDTAGESKQPLTKKPAQIVELVTQLMRNKDGISQLDPPLFALLTRIAIGRPTDPNEIRAQAELQKDPEYFAQFGIFIRQVKPFSTVRDPRVQGEFGREVQRKIRRRAHRR